MRLFITWLINAAALFALPYLMNSRLRIVVIAPWFAAKGRTSPPREDPEQKSGSYSCRCAWLEPVSSDPQPASATYFP